MISVITPTHNPKYLPELYASLLTQTYKDWEWVIFASDGVDCTFADKRVRVIRNHTQSTSVGFLKNQAFAHGNGDILAEVDHDDVLTPDCLEEVAKAYAADTSVGFVYSNNAKLADSFVPYNKDCGWEHRMFDWKGKSYYEMVGFEPDAAGFSFIWYSPDHIRTWRKDVYLKLGGHNPALTVLDDQDLMIRTYLATKVKFIDKCLYLYRITGENTWIKNNALIQTETVQIYNKYAYQLAERQAELMGLMKVDLGGGLFKAPGYTSIDQEGGDITADLSKGIPLPDFSVGVLRAHDFIEHVPDKMKLMSECWRVLSDGGWLMISVPSTDGRGAFQDPTHVSYWNENCFWYWTRKEQAQFIRNTKIRFQEFRLETIYPAQYHVDNKIPYVVAYLRAIKSARRRPHPIKI